MKDHARHWHLRSATALVPIDPLPGTEDEGFAFNDLFNNDEEDMIEDSQPPSLPVPSNTTPRIFDGPRTAQFADWCIEATVTDATTCLVAQALLQSPVSLGIDSVRQINSAAIHLFLCISKLVINTGAQQHRILCTILSMLIHLLPPGVAPWPPMPCSLSSFQSHILNPTNQHSLVSLLPGPKVSMMPDGYHAYCPLEEISAFVLLLPRTIGARAIPLRLKQLCQSRVVTKFMETVDNTNTECLVSIGLLFWLDGWDPSASTKNNRTPVHTASATFLLMDNATGKLFDCRTYPIACGPGKVDHNAVFAAIQTSLIAMSTTSKKVWSHFHGRWTTIRSQLIAFLMDQPERRGSTCLLGGGSKQHPLFSISCDFSELECYFDACSQCVQDAREYISQGVFVHPMGMECDQCYSYSLGRLLSVGKRKRPAFTWLAEDAPGYLLISRPGKLSMAMLIAGWKYATNKFMVEHTWTQPNVEEYFNLLCINAATTELFTTCCRNSVLLNEMTTNPENYPPGMLEFVHTNQMEHPHMYKVPPSPAAWNIGTLDQRPETIMHLAMNTQKAVLKLILHWASGFGRGTALIKRLTPLVSLVQRMRLDYLPVRMFKNNKFGGFVAESFRAFNMLAPWLFRCLLEPAFDPVVFVAPDISKPRSRWTRADNFAWLNLRGIFPPKGMHAFELTALVDGYFQDPNGLPPVQQSTKVTRHEIRGLVMKMFRLFAALFARDLPGVEAANRFEALVVDFLERIDRLGKELHPGKDKPIWLSKYGMLGLLRCRQHFLDYTYLHSLYEGGIEGEGMVKELRPLCPNAVRAGWPRNLMQAYNRRNILNSLTSGFQTTYSLEDQTLSRLDPNYKRYQSWTDVDHALATPTPVSIVMMMNSDSVLTCYVVVRMFQQNYRKGIRINNRDAWADDCGFVYHHVTLDETETLMVEDEEQVPHSYGLLLPNLWDDSEEVKFCVIDKEWRYLDRDGDWTYFST